MIDNPEKSEPELNKKLNDTKALKPESETKKASENKRTHVRSTSFGAPSKILADTVNNDVTTETPKSQDQVNGQFFFN